MHEASQEINHYPEENTSEIVANPEKVKEINDWLESHTSWGSGDSLEEVASGSPEDITKEDVQAAFLNMEPRGVYGETHDIRGYYLTALANKVLENDQDTMELVRPETEKYSRFREIGHGWERGTLVLKGNYRREKVGGSIKGGKVVVHSSVGSQAGSLMSGGELEIMKNAEYGAGFGMTGGEIHIHGKADANVGEKMDDGTILVDGGMGRNWNRYGKTEGPNIGIYKTGGKVIVAEKEY